MDITTIANQVDFKTPSLFFFKEDRNILVWLLFTDKMDLFELLFFKLLYYIVCFSDLSILNDSHLRRKDMLKSYQICLNLYLASVFTVCIYLYKYIYIYCTYSKLTSEIILLRILPAQSPSIRGNVDTSVRKICRDGNEFIDVTCSTHYPKRVD